MHFENYCFNNLFIKAKLNIKKKKKQPKFSKIFGWSEKGKRTSFFRPNDFEVQTKQVTISSVYYWFAKC